jgi:putative PIN family toxin of toxin-antitoxin system
VIVTFDTGILVRATSRSRGPARRLLELLASNPTHTIVLSPFIIAEVGKALSYPHMSAALGITADEIEAHLDYLRHICRLIETTPGMPVVLNDPDDDPVVYTAVGGGANVLCSRDRDLYLPNVIRFCRRYGIEVMDDLQLLALLMA